MSSSKVKAGFESDKIDAVFVKIGLEEVFCTE